MDNITKLYRIDAYMVGLVGGINGDDYLGSRPEFSIKEYAILKETPHGYWINVNIFYSSSSIDKRWVSKTSKKRFAYPTKIEAWNGFKARKRRQLEIYETRCKNLKRMLNSLNPYV